MQSMVDKVISRLEPFKGTGAVVNLVDMFACLTSDVICQYAFAAPYGYLDQQEFAPYWHKAVMKASENSHFFNHFPWIDAGLRMLPPSVVRKTAPQLASLLNLGDVSLSVLRADAETKRTHR